MTQSPEFKAFEKILHIEKLPMSITQKIHGSNAQIHIFRDQYGDLDCLAASRTRYLTLDDDNYGFARFVHENKHEFMPILGEGRHYGEWCGAGINVGEGLNEKMLCLFNWHRWRGVQIHSRIQTVPLLYNGRLSLDEINNAMNLLRTNGSQLVSGFMKPEGIVIQIGDQFFKNVFDAEETKWNEKTKSLGQSKIKYDDIIYLFQPIRLQKIISRDERFVREYPKTLSEICSLYFDDLLAEGQFKETDPDKLKIEKRSLGRSLFYFVKSYFAAEILK